MPSPRVTVVISTYNRSRALRCAIRTVLAQTMGDFELLVVGDGCTDDSEQVVSAIRDPRIRWFNLPANTGHQSSPNNRALAEACGEYIAYLGHDDLWLPHHLERATDALDRSGAGIARSILMSVAPGQDTGMPVLPAAGVGSAPSCTVYRRAVTERIGGWKDYRELAEPPEIDLYRRALAAGFQSVFVPRLTAIKFPALERRDVYRRNDCSEQEAWLERLQTEKDFEADCLARMIVADKVTETIPARKLVRTVLKELGKRLVWRLNPRSGYKAIFWTSRGAGIDMQKRYKGLK